MESVPAFYGKKDGYEDPIEHLETINFVVEEKYPDETKASLVKRMVLRGQLRDEALRWYQRLDSTIRTNWTELSTAFQDEYKLEPKGVGDPNQYFNLLYNLKQGRKSIAEYVAEAEGLYRKCPDPLKAFMGNQFVAGLTDESKLDMVQLYLANEREITFPLAKAAVVKAYSRIGRPSPFDVDLGSRGSGSKPEVSQNEVNAELLNFFKSVRAGMKHQPLPFMSQQTQTQNPPPPQYAPPASTPPYRGNQKGGALDVTCHNCMLPGHYSNNCPDPQVSYRQKALNRAKVEEMNASGSRLPQQAPAAQAAVAQHFQDQLSPKVEGPSDSVGSAGRAMAHLPMTPAILRRGQPLDSFPAGPSMTAALSKTVRFEEVEEEEGEGLGVAAPANRVQKPPTRPREKQQPRRSTVRAAERVLNGPSSRDLPNRVEDVTNDVETIKPQTSQSTVRGEGSSRPDSRIIRLPLPPSMRAQATVEEVEDEDRPRRNVVIDSRPPEITQVIDPPMPATSPTLPYQPQRRLSRISDQARSNEPLEPQYDGPRETVAINMAKDRNRFQVSQFLDAPVTMPLWQLLDRSPQVRAQLARAMASSKPSRRGRKTGVVAAAMVGKKAPIVVTEAHEDEDVMCLYIQSWVNDSRVGKTLADTGAVVELINPRLVDTLHLPVFEMDEEWTLQLADDGIARVRKYVWVPVNVAGVVATIRAFILGMGNIYDLLLSKRWMRRVRAVEDHGQGTLTIQGKDGVQRLVRGTETEPLDIELIDGPSVDEWETALAEEEIARLADELDGYDYLADQGKALHR